MRSVGLAMISALAAFTTGYRTVVKFFMVVDQKH